jgi:hypothetical protein
MINQARDQGSYRLQLFLVGGLLALGLILIEAGVGQIMLNRDRTCRETAAGARLGPDPYEVCLSETSLNLVTVMTYGFPAASNPAPGLFPSLLINGAAALLLGGVFAQLSLRWAIGGYLGLHALVLIVLSIFRFLSTFIF